MTEPTDRDGAPLILGATYRSTTGNKFRCTNADPTLSDDCFVRQSDGEVFKLREVGEWRIGAMYADLTREEDKA